MEKQIKIALAGNPNCFSKRSMYGKADQNCLGRQPELR